MQFHFERSWTRSIGGPHGAALHPNRAGFDMMSGPRAASTGSGVAGLPPDSRYVGTAPSTTRVRSQSPAGSAPLNADKHQGRRQVPAETGPARRSRQRSALLPLASKNRSVCDRTGDHLTHRLRVGRVRVGGAGNHAARMVPAASTNHAQRRAPYKGNRRTCSDGQAPGFSGSSTSSRRKLGKGCRRGGTSRVLSGAGSVP